MLNKAKSVVTSNVKKIVSVVGARPQFVKAAMLAAALSGISEVKHVVIHTGQHYDKNMSDLFFQQLDMNEPDYNLAIGSGPHGAQTGRMLEAIEQVLIAEHPDWILVYGDTNSTLAGALAGAKLLIPTAHVEAGLRSFNTQMPEEINRVVTDHLCSHLFAPTDSAAHNLCREGVDYHRISIVGDVMYDAALHFAAKAQSHSRILQELRLRSKKYALATFHRAENTNGTGERLAAIMRALSEFSREMPVVFPMHPRTRTALRGTCKRLLEDVCVIEPVGYLDMVLLEKNARVIATDSGGVQREAFYFNVPCVTVRDETEWVELIASGWNRLAPPRDHDTVLYGLQAALKHKCVSCPNPYGDGRSTEKIIAALLQPRVGELKLNTNNNVMFPGLAA